MKDKQLIQKLVKMSLLEDVGVGDITAELIDEHQVASAVIITREPMVLCGQAWVNEVFLQLGDQVQIDWLVSDGSHLSAGQELCHLKGNVRALLTGERTALNFLQMLSGTATLTQHYVAALKGTKTQLFDTRKTIPGFRLAQKYAVRCGGGVNHREGLFDAYLIKENHIAASGSIAKAVAQAKKNHADKKAEVEVESLDELKQALETQVDIVMLDNFSLDDIRKAVEINEGQVKLEVSGNVTLENIHEYAQTGVDYISVGALTKHIRAIDLSMRVEV